MNIENLNLINFRNYDSLNIEFNNKLNIIIGKNAQGKTNILESIYYLSITRPVSFLNDKNIIKNGNDCCSIISTIKLNETSFKLRIVIDKNNKKLFIDNNEIKKHSDFIGKLKVILYTPDSLNLIKLNPNNRRRFLNVGISQLFTRYINILNDFNVILRQRNEYLKIMKLGNYNVDYFDIITEKFVDLSVMIYKYRKKYVNQLNEQIDKIFYDIFNLNGLSINYITNFSIEDDDNLKTFMLKKMHDNLSKEILYGNTLLGPHRDDFLLEFCGNDMVSYGSQGQLKLAVLTLKLAEVNVFYQVSGTYPVLLLDDLFSELDIINRNKIIKYLKNLNIQIFITTTDLKNINKKILGNIKVYEIKNGRVFNK